MKADAIEMAWELVTEVFGLDPEADIEVFTGGYSAATKVASRTGEAGTCAAV